MTDTKRFHIACISSGADLGVFEGCDAEAAYDAMLADAGYADRDENARATHEIDVYDDINEDLFYRKAAESNRADIRIREIA